MSRKKKHLKLPHKGEMSGNFGEVDRIGITIDEGSFGLAGHIERSDKKT